MRRSEIILFSVHLSCFRAQGLPGERVERLGGLQQDLRDRRDGERLHKYRQQCFIVTSGEDEDSDPAASARGPTLPDTPGLQVVRQRPELQTR